MKNLMTILILLATPLSSFAMDYTCQLTNGNVSGRAAATVNKLADATLTIKNGYLNFDTVSAIYRDNLEFSPKIYLSMTDFGPTGKFTTSSDGRTLSTKSNYKNGGPSSMTSGQVEGIFDQETKEFHVKTQTGLGIFKTLKLDFIVQCN